MAFQVLPPIAFRASLSHKRLDAIESLTVDDGGVMTVHLIHRNLPAVQLLPLRGNVMLFLHDLAACVLFGFQNQLYAGEGEVFCVMDAFHAPFVQFSGNGDVGFPGKVLSENEAHNLRLFRYDQALVAFPAIAEHFLMGMDFTMFKLFFEHLLDVPGQADAFFLREAGQDGEHDLAVGSEGIDPFTLETNFNA